jgi:hypothetical protein
LTVTVERIDGGKLRCTGATWSDAVVIYPGVALALVNIERQALPSAPRLPRVWYSPPADTPRSREDDFRAPDDGVLVTCPAWDDAVVVLLDQVLTLSNHERQVHIGRGLRAAERPSTPRIS